MLIGALTGCGLSLPFQQDARATPVHTEGGEQIQNASVVRTTPIHRPFITEHIEPPIWAGPILAHGEVQAEAVSSWLTHTLTRGEVLVWVALFLVWRSLSRRWHARRLWRLMQQRLQHATQDRLTAQRHFHALLAHELRGPAASLNSHVSQLSDLSLPPRARVHVRRIHQGVDRLRSLLEQLLSLSRAQLQPDAEMHVGHVSVHAVLRDVLEGLMPQIQHQNQTVAWVSDHDVWLQMAAIDLSTLLRNLLENASHHTPPGGMIEVSLIEAPGKVWIQVADNGPGIPQDQLDRVFDPFYRLQSNVNGSGLGLAIVQMLAARWDGQVTLCNRSGGGLEANVCLPVMQTLTRPYMVDQPHAP